MKISAMISFGVHRLEAARDEERLGRAVALRSPAP
jgi:hypothetical protein